MTPSKETLLPVTQADHHEAEAALFELRGYRVKIKPEHWLSQAFARHREQAVRDWLARAGLVRQGGEPVAWLYSNDDDLTPIVSLERWRHPEQAGWTETPLYAHPPASPTAEVVEAIPHDQ